VLRRVGEQLLQLALDALLLERRRLPHVVRHIGEHLGDLDVEPVLGRPGALSHDDVALLLLDHRRRRHPVLRLEPPGVSVDHHRPVGLDHEQPQRLRQDGGEPAGVADLAAGDDETHAGAIYERWRTMTGR
jgi:hypothetical protein